MKIQNTTQSSKRIRLTALDSAMSNIDDSTGAVAKVGREVLLCLSKAALVQGIVPKLTFQANADDSTVENSQGVSYSYPTLAEVYEGLVGGKESILITQNSVTANIRDNGLGPVPHRLPIDPAVDEGYDLFIAEYTANLGYLLDNGYVKERLADVNDTLPIAGVDIGGQIMPMNRDMILASGNVAYTPNGEMVLGNCPIKIGGYTSGTMGSTVYLYDRDGVTIKSSMSIETSRVFEHSTNGTNLPLPPEGLEFGFVGTTPEALMWSWNELNQPGTWSVWKEQEIVDRTSWNLLSAELNGESTNYAKLSVSGDNTFKLEWLGAVPVGVVEEGFVVTLTYPLYEGVEAPEFFCEYPHIVATYNNCVRLQIYVPRIVSAAQPQ